MIICSCAVVTDHDIEAALIEIFSLPNAPLPTPGVVFRHLSKRMNCCSCAPLTDGISRLTRCGVPDAIVRPAVRARRN